MSVKNLKEIIIVQQVDELLKQDCWCGWTLVDFIQIPRNKLKKKVELLCRLIHELLELKQD